MAPPVVAEAARARRFQPPERTPFITPDMSRKHMAYSVCALIFCSIYVGLPIAIFEMAQEDLEEAGTKSGLGAEAAAAAAAALFPGPIGSSVRLLRPLLRVLRWSLFYYVVSSWNLLPPVTRRVDAVLLRSVFGQLFCMALGVGYFALSLSVRELIQALEVRLRQQGGERMEKYAGICETIIWVPVAVMYGSCYLFGVGFTRLSGMGQPPEATATDTTATAAQSATSAAAQTTARAQTTSTARTRTTGAQPATATAGAAAAAATGGQTGTEQTPGLLDLETWMRLPEVTGAIILIVSVLGLMRWTSDDALL